MRNTMINDAAPENGAAQNMAATPSMASPRQDRLVGKARENHSDVAALDGYARYAVYFSPPEGHPLDLFGRAWFGRDAQGNATSDRFTDDVPVNGAQVPQGMDPAIRRAVIAGPARYGLHATLKPPFALAGGYGVRDLDRSIKTLAAGLAPMRLPALRLDRMRSFVALVGRSDSARLNNLCAQCVVALDRMRAPASAAEKRRRQAAGLSTRQAQLLDHWGYPYVLDEFRFHLTLTGALDDDLLAARITAVLQDMLRPALAAPLNLTDLALFGDPGQGRPLVLIKRYPLGPVVRP